MVAATASALSRRSGAAMAVIKSRASFFYAKIIVYLRRRSPNCALNDPVLAWRT